MVSCPSGLGNYVVCKSFAVEMLPEINEIFIISLEHGSIKVKILLSLYCRIVQLNTIKPVGDYLPLYDSLIIILSVLT